MPKRRQYAYFAGLAALAIAGIIASIVMIYSGFERRQYSATLAVGAELYRENCAACHGANLEGQVNWQDPNPDGTLLAPPHDADGHTWHHADQLLINYITLGGQKALAQDGITDFNSGMPGFESILSDAEIEAVLDYIKSRWPDDLRQVQRDRTLSDEDLSD